MSKSRSVTAVTVHVAVVEHRQGIDTWAAGSLAALYAKLYEYVSQWWSEWDLPDEIPADHYTAVDIYFDHTRDQDKGEWLETFTHEIVLEEV